MNPRGTGSAPGPSPEPPVPLDAAPDGLRDDSGRPLRRIRDVQPALIELPRHTGCHLSGRALTNAPDPGAERGSNPPGATERLLREMIVPRDIETTFAFFSDAANLNRLTPPQLNFEIVTPQPVAMRRGALIDYRIRLWGIGVRWRTEITCWEPPFRFVDVQLKGPYRYWRHEHRFETVPEGTRVVDEVEYRATFSRLTHPLFVRRELLRIFDYRRGALLRCLAGPEPRS